MKTTRSKNKDNLASKKDYMIQKVKTNWPKNLRQSDDLLLNKDKNKDDFSNKYCISLEIKTIKQLKKINYVKSQWKNFSSSL